MSKWLDRFVHVARSSGIGISGLIRQSEQHGLNSHLSDSSELMQLNEKEAGEVDEARSAALVEVIVTYGCMCKSGKHGEQIFQELREGILEMDEFKSSVFFLAREDPTTYNCISVHVNNVLVFGCQARKPSVSQLRQAIKDAMEGKRPSLIRYREATPCDYFGCTQKHKYQI